MKDINLALLKRKRRKMLFLKHQKKNLIKKMNKERWRMGVEKEKR